MMSRLFRETVFIFFVALAIYFLLILLSYDPADPAWSTTGENALATNKGGIAGAWLADILFYVIGIIAYFLPTLLLFSGWHILTRTNSNMSSLTLSPIVKILGMVMAFSAMSGLATMIASEWRGLPLGAGGLVGHLLTNPLIAISGEAGTAILLVALSLVGTNLLTGLSWLTLLEKSWAITGQIVWRLRDYFIQLIQLIQARSTVRQNESDSVLHTETNNSSTSPTVAVASKTDRVEPILADHIPLSKVAIEGDRLEPTISATASTDMTNDMPPVVIDQHNEPVLPLSLPSLGLLDEAKVERYGYSQEKLTQLSRQLEEKLQDFNVTVSVVAVQPGPVVTRFELQPSPGLKVSRVTGLAKDLARAMSISSVRVVEVIPGKPLIGIEIPNEQRETVRLKEILSSEHYQHSRSALVMALGKDIAGKPVVADLEKMPHLLVAGTTGSGKSVAVNAMILSLLYKSTPEQVRLIMVDPKMLELSVYADIPHLLTPVVTDMKEAANALRWSVAEMERRYPLMAALGVRNIKGFNKKVEEAIRLDQPLMDPTVELAAGESAPLLSPLPYIVIIIDELADMMMIVGKQVEESIARLAQKARAAGIHLILATQRPSVDVITGLIKANIPTRMAFQVSSKVDSRTILDQMGAEQLLGQGDMLYLPPGTGLPERVHGAFVDDHEVHNVVASLKQSGQPDYIEAIVQDAELSAASTDESDGESDPLYDQAVQVVISSQRASVSGVQRRLKVGYNRAARLVEAMEIAGVVSAMQANGSRVVLVKNVEDE